jgi:hypothetical protein
MYPQKQATGNKHYNWQLFRLLITPSWISGLACLLVATAMTSTFLLRSHYESSELLRQFLVWQQTGESGTLLQAIGQQHYSPLGKAISTAQLFIFWFAIGVIIYAIIDALHTVIRGIRNIADNLEYVNAGRQHLLRETALQLTRQLGSLLVWLLLAILTLKIIIPDALGIIHIASEYLPSLEAVGLLIAVPIGLALCLHMHIVLLRLFLGRPRIWHSESYVESLS